MEDWQQSKQKFKYITPDKYRDNGYGKIGSQTVEHSKIKCHHKIHKQKCLGSFSVYKPPSFSMFLTKVSKHMPNYIPMPRRPKRKVDQGYPTIPLARVLFI